MWVVYDSETGWSDESMRFDWIGDAAEFITDSDNASAYRIRYED